MDCNVDEMTEKKEMFVAFQPGVHTGSGFEQLSEAMILSAWHAIDEMNWKAFDYAPEVAVKIAYAPGGLMLWYKVREEQLRALYHKTNDPVYRDSCVEFFLSFEEGYYYNFEFNCIGTVLAAYGTADKERRTYFSTDQLEEISVFTHIRKAVKTFEWQLWAYIPFTLFIHTKESILPMSGNKCLANFYKCGDDLDKPHYLSWNRVNSAVPNFHLPEDFGILHFL